MPHLLIDYARPLEQTLSIREVMDVAFEAAARSGVMQPADIKVRATPFDHYRLEGGITTFLHVTVQLLAGRTAEQKEHVALLMRADLAEAFPDIHSISVDIRDMDPIAYKKRLLTVG
ncbi:5-carboxymethyl-2-hydroxymuconate Delta-isomerase [Segnochrobactraceae bacterium EtOH-i3]